MIFCNHCIILGCHYVFLKMTVLSQRSNRIDSHNNFVLKKQHCSSLQQHQLSMKTVEIKETSTSQEVLMEMAVTCIDMIINTVEKAVQEM